MSKIMELNDDFWNEIGTPKRPELPTVNVSDNQLLLPNGKVITFNAEQYEAVCKIRKWLKGGGNTFTLKGGAGTGKSSILKKILDSYRFGVIVSAPSHKAKRVVMNTTGKDGKTLQALLGLRPDVDLENFSPNFPQFNPIAVAQIGDYNLVIIDEASMINFELYELIQEKIKNTHTKVLYVGDSCQIPPVGEKESVVFNENIINEYHELTKIERQKDTNPLMLLYDDLRNNLNSVDGGFLRKSNVNELGEGVTFIIDKRQFRREILEKFSTDSFKKDVDFAKVIAWKNDTVIASNQVIRQELFKHNTDIVEIGDVLMGYRTISTENQRMNIIENSADYRVMDKLPLEENAYGITGFNVNLREELARGEFKFQNVFIVDVNDHENLHLYAQMHDFFRDMGKSDKRAWKKYYEFRRCNILMKSIDKYKNGLYRSSSDCIVKDMDYGYAITGHKSQGSTYSHSFVMQNDIYENWVIKERNQIFYVAMSRPTTSAVVLSNRLDD